MIFKNKIPEGTDLYDRILQAMDTVTVPDSPWRHAEQTPDCPELPLFGEARQQGWTGLYARYARHVQTCPFCQKVEAMFQRDSSTVAKPGQGDTDFRAGTVVSLTSLWVAKNWPALVGQLEPWLPAWLMEAKLADRTNAAEQAGAFLKFVKQHWQEPAEGSFRVALRAWLAEFAQVPLELVPEWNSERVAAYAVDLALESTNNPTPTWASKVRELARSPKALMEDSVRQQLTEAGATDDALDTLFSKALIAERKGQGMFELTAAA